MTIQVMLVDDSAVVRQVLSAVLNEAPDINVCQVAADPIIAQMYLKMKWPDVIVLDIEMPRMDGLTFLKQLMHTRPIPVVICSSLAEKGCKLSLEALSAGAVDIVTKPKSSVKGFLLETKQQFWNVIRAAAKASVKKLAPLDSQSHTSLNSGRDNSGGEVAHRTLRQVDNLLHVSPLTDKMIAIGTSTGGTQALEYLLTGLSRTCPGIAVVQHMPEKFTRAFAEHLNQKSEVEIKEAESGDRIIPGKVFIAPGGHHMEITRSGAQYVIRVFRGPHVNRHCPSVDVLFRSVAKNVGQNALGVIMTGMGDDGAKGLLEMRKAGALTVAQDEASSVVFGMPREAIAIGASQKVLSLTSIFHELSDFK